VKKVIAVIALCLLGVWPHAAPATAQTLTLVTNNLCFRSDANSLYMVGANSTKSWFLTDTAGGCGPHEIFTEWDGGAFVALQANYNHQWIQVVPAVGWGLQVSGTSVGTYEKFQTAYECCGGNNFWLQSEANGRYVTPDPRSGILAASAATLNTLNGDDWYYLLSGNRYT
jgi:hypothetical protein